MRAVGGLPLVLALGGCPKASTGDGGTGESGASNLTDTDDPSATSVDPSATSIDPSAAETDEPAPWFEVGWGTNDFNELVDTLPVLVGPQGLSMFSLPIRGAGFYNPPDPSFDNPDMPMMQAWVDIDGYELTADGHFNEVVDYPALFYPSLDLPGTLEGPAVWMVLPDDVTPQDIEGRTAWLHAELLDRDGLLLVDEHELVVGLDP